MLSQSQEYLRVPSRKPSAAAIAAAAASTLRMSPQSASGSGPASVFAISPGAASSSTTTSSGGGGGCYGGRSHPAVAVQSESTSASPAPARTGAAGLFEQALAKINRIRKRTMPQPPSSTGLPPAYRTESGRYSFNYNCVHL